MRTIAVLIDAENVQASFGDKVFSYANSLGNVIVKEIYGVASALGLWVEPVLKYAIHPNLTIKASKFKNTSDISLVIGAMDLLLAGEVDTVIIVSSDSDFSTLSVRLRSAGLEVIGMGTEKVNPLWRTACSSFVILSAQAPQRPVAYTVKPPEPEEVPVIKAQKTEEKAVIVPITKPVAVQTPDNVSRPVSEQEQKTAALKKQGTPVVVLPESAKLAGNAAAAQPKQPRPRAAVTHSDRTAAIRSLITKHLEMNGGKMSITNIFHALNSLPDYHVDQQGSKRKPLNYLMWLFGDVFAFEDGMIMFPELSKGAKLKGEQQADRANKDEPEGVKKLLPGAVPTAPEAEKSESGDAPAANLSVPGKVIPVQSSTMTAAEKTNNAEPVKRIGASPDQNLTAAAEKKAKERHAETAAAKPAEKVMTPAAKQIPTVETAAEKAEEKRTETVVPEQAEKQMNPAVEQNPAAEKAEEKRTETVVPEQAEKQMNPVVEQNPVVEIAAEQAEKQPAETAASERTEKLNSAVEQNPAAETAAEKAEKQPVEAVVPEQPEKQMNPAVEQNPAAETAAEQAEKQPAETVASEQTEKQMNPAVEQTPAAETVTEKTEEQRAEAATPEQAEKQMNPVAEQNPTAETVAEKTEEPRAEVTASEQAEKQMNPAAEQTPAAEAVAEQTEEQRAEARTSEQAEKATNPAEEQAPAAESAAEKAEDHPQEETVKSQSEATTVPAQTEVSSAEKAEAKPAEDGKAVKPEKPAEAAPENKPAGKPRDTERGKKAASTESEKRSGKKDGNRHGASGKKQNEPRGNGKTSAEEKSKDEQNKRAPQTAADQTSQEKHPADEKGNSKEKNVPPKQNGTPERSGSKNEPKDNHNRKTASNAQDEARNAALENTTLDKIGIQPRPVKILMDNGYRTLADVARVRDGDLLRIKGIGKTTVDLIRLSVKKAAEKE